MAMSAFKSAILIFILGSLPAPLRPAADELPRGQIIDRVVCAANTEQSYALYLPSRYTPDRASPIIFCFDPGARGRLPVELFRDAAERYGYILAASNNSRNGPAGLSSSAMQAMWNDTQSRLSIDPARAFAAGMSGGARVACGFAQSGSFLAGVIAFAAGFPGAQAPKKGGFIFFGAAGVDDFNYPELRRLDGDLEKLGMTKRIVSFAGGHGWPPAAVCIQAIEWLELQAMKAGKLTRNSAMIDGFFAKEEASIGASETAGVAGEVYLLTRAVANDFRGLKDISSLEGSAARLAASREVKKYLQEEKDMQATQNSREAEMLALWNQRYGTENSGTAIASAASLIEELNRQSKATSDSASRRIARRVLQGSYIHAIEESRSLLERKDYQGAAQMLELAIAIHTDRPQILFNLAAIYAKARDRRKTLEALRKAVEQGYRDAVAIESDDSFQFLRSDPAIKKILTQIRN